MTDGDGRHELEEREDKVRRLQEAILEAQQSANGDAIVDEELEERLAPLKAKATRLISHRDRSIEELRSRLLEMTGPEGDPVEPELVDLVVDRCVANGMLDDGRFAHEWVRQRQHNQRKSVSVLRRELRDKGVASAVIEDALAQIDQADQDEILEALVTKKAGTVTTVPADRGEYEKALRRIVGVAARRGFPEGRSLQFARQALDARVAELTDGSYS